MRKGKAHGFSETEVLDIGSQVLTGLRALHAEKIVHRASFPCNIRLLSTATGFVVKIADFSSCKKTPTVAAGISFAKRTIYEAPELLKNARTADVFRADVISVGKTLAGMMTDGMTLRRSMDLSRLWSIVAKLCTCKLRTSSDVYSAGLVYSVTKMLAANPTTRGSEGSNLNELELLQLQHANKGISAPVCCSLSLQRLSENGLA